MIRFKWLSVVAALFLTLAISMPGFAQSRTIPRDVTNPLSDGEVSVRPGRPGTPVIPPIPAIPTLLTGINSIIRPQDVAVLQFDSLLDPSNGGDPSRLSAAAVSIQLNHRVAQQQVELAIQFLLDRKSVV